MTVEQLGCGGTAAPAWSASGQPSADQTPDAPAWDAALPRAVTSCSAGWWEPVASDAVDEAVADAAGEVLGSPPDAETFTTASFQRWTEPGGIRALDRSAGVRRTPTAMDPDERVLSDIVASYADQVATATTEEERAFELGQLRAALRRATGAAGPTSLAERRAVIDARYRFRADDLGLHGPT